MISGKVPATCTRLCIISTLVALLGIVLGSLHISAQPIDTVPAMHKMFGVPDDEFFIGGWCKAFYPSTQTITGTDLTNRTMALKAWDDASAHNDSLWRWLDTMGINVIRRDANWGAYSDVGLDGSGLRAGRRLILSASGIIDQVGYGAEAMFYFTDSIRYREEPTAFARRSGGTDVENPTMKADGGVPAHEVDYESTNTSSNQVIAEHPTFFWKASQANRFEWYNSGGWKQRLDSTIQNAEYFFRRSHQDPDTNYHINVRGHLFKGGSASDTATLLWVEVWHQRPYESTYKGYQGGAWVDSVTVSNDTILISRFGITKAQMLPPDPDVDASWNVFRDVDSAFYPRFCATGQTGPLYPGNESPSIDIKVRWTGAERVALHSLALRDHLGHRILTDDAALIQQVNDRADELVYRGANGHRLPSIIALSLAGEEPSVQAAPTARAYKWIRDHLNSGVNSDFTVTPPFFNNDSLPGWIDEGYPESLHRLYEMDFVSSEGRPFVHAWMKDIFGAPHDNIPSLRKHNGGHFSVDTAGPITANRSIPLALLDIDTPSTRLANVEKYETMLQRLGLGQFIETGAEDPFDYLLLRGMSRAAQVARDFHRRNIFIYFNTSDMGFDIRDSLADPINHDTVRYLDTVVHHIHEAAEQRAILNTALAFGCKGIHYQTLHGDYNVLRASPNRGGLLEGLTDLGSNGPLTSDDVQDSISGIRFIQPDTNVWNSWYTQTVGNTISNVYLGWGNRSREVRRYNRWLTDSVGPLLMKLNWRDAYSIHYTVPQPYMLKGVKYRVYDDIAATHSNWDSTYYRSVGYRPLPGNEIVTAVSSYRRDWAGPPSARYETLTADSLSRTFVELGLFYTKRGDNNPMRDTNWLMVVNRRALERPDDYPITSPEGKILDSLAEMRLITLKLNLLNFDQFNFVRVREMGPDTTRLPLATSARTPLDTVVHADSIVKLTLRSGGAALLRITYLEPDTNIVSGRISFSNQRKIIWDSTQHRYHCVYMMGTETSRWDSIRYRRSVPMTDSSGSVLWENDALAFTVSRMSDASDSIIFNRHPSLTIRRIPPLAGVGVTIVWAAHRILLPYTGRQILLRTIWSPDGTGAAQLDNIVDVIDSTINGDTASAWGTPVICRTDGGDIIAWSDSLIGIKARVRVLGDPLGTPEWWRSPATYTDTIHVSAQQTNRFGMAGSFPSVPTFAHIVSKDSNCAIVWEQPMAGTHAAPYPCDIYYKRLQHTQGSAGDTLIALDSSLAVVSNGGFGPHRHPSISQHQDAWRAVHDAITWEQPSPTNPQSGMLIHMRSLWTETRTFNATDQPDVILPKPNLCGWTHALVSNPGGKWLYPNICSINPRDSSDQIKARSSIAFNLPLADC